MKYTTLIAPLVTLPLLLALASLPKNKTAPERRHHTTATGFVFKTLTEGGQKYDYTVYVPRNYDAGKKWPVIMFLHGSGESGTDGLVPVAQGIGQAIMHQAGKWPFIVIFPQKPEVDDEWEQHETAVMGMLAQAQKDYNTDNARLYLTGLSMGGHGAWVLGARHPNVWAAVAPIAGYVNGDNIGIKPRALVLPPFSGTAADLAAPLKATPVWAFHGDADNVVPIKDDTDMVNAVKAEGGDAKLTVYPGVGHNSWDKAYREETLYTWFLSHQLKG